MSTEWANEFLWTPSVSVYLNTDQQNQQEVWNILIDIIICIVY